MSPYEQMAAKYAAHPQARPFEWYVAHHARHGFVYSTPQFFVMGRPVRRDANAEHITEPTFLFQHDVCNCWFVHAMAGDLSRVWDILPWPLGWVAWERILDGTLDLRFYPTERVRRLCLPTTELLDAPG